MTIRTYQAGDESVQAEIYNEAAAKLPKFKPATIADVARRCQAFDFDPQARFYAEADGKVVGYAVIHGAGRVSFPWCRPAHETAAEPLFETAIEAARGRGLPSVFAAVRNDWEPQKQFFLQHGFRLAREMVNFVINSGDLPTRPGVRRTPLTELRREDLPAIFQMAPSRLRAASPEELGRQLLANHYFPPSSVFVLRNRSDESPVAVGVAINNPAYADPNQVDASMPCFRLGAFGTEGMHTKRINGLFSFLMSDQRDLNQLALDLMGHAASLQDETGTGSLAAQVPSDLPHLHRFYQRYFRRQGSFPIYERDL